MCEKWLQKNKNIILFVVLVLFLFCIFYNKKNYENFYAVAVDTECNTKYGLKGSFNAKDGTKICIKGRYSDDLSKLTKSGNTYCFSATSANDCYNNLALTPSNNNTQCCLDERFAHIL